MSNSSADKGFLAGETGRRHSLAGLPLGVAALEDDMLHAPAVSGHFSSTETSYYGFSVPEHRLNGEIYLWFHPILKVMSASIYIWKGIKSSSLACEYVNHHHYLPWPENDIADFKVPPLNLHITVVEPLKTIQIEFNDAMRGVRLSYRLDAIMPAAIRPGGYHFTQAMRTYGVLELRGETIKIDGFFSRDRSWGQERREDPMPLPPLTWTVGVFDQDLAFHVLAMDDPALGPEWTEKFPGIKAGDNLFWGYLWKDRQLTPLAKARKLTTRESDGLAPRLIEMELEDIGGRQLQLRGYVQSRMPWQTWQNMNTFFCQVRWETGGKIGFGDAQDVQFADFVRQFAR